MKRKQFSPTQLSGYLGCKHQAQLEIGARKKFFERPIRTNRIVENLQKKGLEFENAYVAYLKSQGKQVADVREFKGENAREQTIDAMRQGADVIVQAVLGNDLWWGKADFLFKTDKPSVLGNWSYEVADTKLARQTKGGAILQLCIYNYLLTEILGGEKFSPDYMYVVRPNPEDEDNFEKVPYRLEDFQSYFRLIKEDFEMAMEQAADMSLDSLDASAEDLFSKLDKQARDLMVGMETKPEPTAHCDICAWWTECNARRRADDYLHFIAGIRPNQVEELREHGINTLEAFVKKGARVIPKLTGNKAGYEKLLQQAALQQKHKLTSKFNPKALPPIEWLEPAERRGFNLLPEACEGDIFFDLEGDHFAKGGPFEYLWGYCYLEAGELKYAAKWVHNRAEEKAAFEEFMDFLMARIERYPELRIYHFAPYEPGALKRLVGRYSTRNSQLDELLRSKRMVDLYTVVRQSMVAGIERYSIKELEQFYGLQRDQNLEAAKLSRWAVEGAIENQDRIEPQDREIVECYNADDCRSTFALRNWLEEQRQELIEGGAEFIRPVLGDPEASEEINAAEQRRLRIFAALTDGLPEDRKQWTELDQAKNLLAHMLGFFKREINVAWWEHFRLMELEPEDQLRERKVIYGLKYLDNYKEKKSQVHVYSFPPQEIAISFERSLRQIAGKSSDLYDDQPSLGTLFKLDFEKREVHIKRNGKTLEAHPTSVMQDEVVRVDKLIDSLASFAESVVENGLEGEGPYQAGRALLLKELPAFDEGISLDQNPPNLTNYCEQMVLGLDHSFLAVQGPPGTGKTFNGAHMIIALMEEGMRVGVTAVSHKVIQNLLLKVREIADSKKLSIRIAQKTELEAEGIERVNDNGLARDKLTQNYVLGSTSWLWADDKSEDCVDYLFIDEAGQMSLANVLACSRATRNLVLLGDPQQLQQPQRGMHPDGSEVAALVHALDGRQTLPWDRGIFLGTTYRLHPNICDFNSTLYYENRLKAFAEMVNQRLTGDTPFKGSGLFYVPIEHKGNQSSSSEEVEAVVEIVQQLTNGSVIYTKSKGGIKPLSIEDVKIIAPYNAQVGALKSRLPELEIGTVDKFQGQEAPVIIYSMASSSVEDAPRGMSFLFDPHRLNVAVSRARSTFILVGSPQLKFPDCKTPEQMRWANGLCYFFEKAREVSLLPEAVEGG